LLERKIEVKGISPAELFGVNNTKLKHLISFFPKLKVTARGNVVTIVGDDEVMDEFELKFDLVLLHFQEFNELTLNNIDNLMLEDGQKLLKSDGNSGILVHGNHGAKIKAYTAIALAVRALKAKEVKRIILTRPAVEAGENLGFLPGDLKEKLDPYMMPLYDALRDMIPPEKLADMIEFGIIEIAPLAFMRGRTLDKAFVILDEAQNTTTMQMKMFLTRMGMTAKFVVTGDMSQVDLPRSQRSGLAYAMNALEDVEGVGIIRMGEADVIRHQLVKRIIAAFDVAEAQDKKNEEEREKKRREQREENRKNNS
jgi:phosphate starvation-inducible PhoH-like protein